MRNSEYISKDQFDKFKKKELIALLQESLKRESTQMLSNFCAVSKRDVEIHHLEMQLDKKDSEILRLKQELKPNNFWLKMSIALGFLLFLSILISLSKFSQVIRMKSTEEYAYQFSIELFENCTNFEERKAAIVEAWNLAYEFTSFGILMKDHVEKTEPIPNAFIP